MSKKLAALVEARDGDANNFGIIRLVAASLVLVSHAFVLSGDTSATEPLIWLTGGQQTFGGFAVQIFFIVSGFLVTRSLVRGRSIIRFGVSRALRILPGLAVAVLFAAFIVGPAMTTLPLADYFGQTAFRKYFLTAVLDIRYQLPGVFQSHPNPAVNGSLWSLEIEAMMYLLLPVLLGGFLIAFRSGERAAGWAALAALAVFCVWAQGIAPHPRDGFYAHFISDLGQFFFAGSAAYLWRHHVPMSPGLALLATIIVAASAAFGWFDLASVFAVGYLVLWIAYAVPKMAERLTRGGDISYGIYIYAFMMQQVAVALFSLGSHWWGNILLAFPPTIVLATASWHLIERPSLRHRSAVSRRVEACVGALRRPFGRPIAAVPAEPADPVATRDASGAP